MRCCTCDKNLSDYESTQRHAETGEFLDMCNKCLMGLNIPTKGRNDLSNIEVYEEDLDGDISLEDFIKYEQDIYE